ncbi:MAG: phage/plasmid replication protein [Candidatus Kapaibacterium sp.]
MIDSIRLIIHRHIDLSQNQSLDFLKEEMHVDGTYSKLYTYKNMRIEEKDFNIYISGSLTKLALGNNYLNASRNDIRNAANELCKVIGFKINEAVVTRIDLGIVVVTNHCSRMYIEHLRPPNNRYEWITHKTGITFRNESKSIILYDKVEESGNNSLKNKNLLRYEIQIRKGCKKFLLNECKVSIPNDNKLSTVLTDEYFDFFKSYLNNTYTMIKKDNIKLILPFPETPSEFLKFGFTLWLKNQDMNQIIMTINNFYKKNKIKAHNRRKMIQMINTLAVSNLYTYNLMSELTNKITSEINKF